MDFEDTEQEANFRREARSWLSANATPLASGERAPTLLEWRREPGALVRAKRWMARKAQGRWACLGWPIEFGGRAASRLHQLIWEQEEAEFDVPPNMFTIGQNMLGPTLMTHGTAAQKERYLGPMLRGDEVWCQLFSEPGAGSDLAGLSTRAVRDGDDWVVDGQKIWTSGAQYCDFGMILTRTAPEQSKHQGITYFVVDMRSPGIELRPIRQMSGDSGFNEVFFSGVRIPEAHRVGEVNQGWQGALTTLMNERQALSGGGSGTGFRELLSLARSARRGSGPAVEDAGVRARLADIYVLEKGLQFTRYRSLSALSRGATPGAESSIGKMIAAPLKQKIAGLGLELAGRAGTVVDSGLWPEVQSLSDMYLAAPGGRIAGGTDEVMRNVVAERVLGLPPEPRIDKGVPFAKLPRGSN